ncbi:MAG TPA: tetratricopeptide repeat protein [Candidatus Dormibacteraeota bacterium]|nr:tetratricopeptide repeat protein [Candidatus Dormibacteraeota bacterium]
MSRRILVFLSLLAAIVPSACGQTDAWLQVRTPHFLIVSNSTEKDARRAARQFEGMRSVFQRVFPDADLDTASPMLVLAVQDKRSLQALEPTAYLGKGQLTLIGLFLSAPEKNYVLILLNATGTHPYAPIYHEYAHFVFSRTRQWMPLWLTEGIAEFYQNTEILEDKVRLGKGDPSLQYVIDSAPLLPLPTLFAVDPHSPYYHEQDKGSIFYAESWALTHYLKDKDDLDGTHRLTDFLDLLQKNVGPTAAATQAFGDLDQLELDFRRHAVSGQYAVSEISGSTDVDDSSFIVQSISQTQADAMRAEFLAHDGRETDAQTLLQNVLRDDPSNVGARETMGYIAYRRQNYDEARKWYQEAIKLDPNSFVAHYFFATATIRKGAPDKASQTAVEESLRAVMKINPSFAPAYDALAIFYSMHGIHLADAHDLIEKAVQLEPGVPEIRIDEAQVLSTMKKDKEAVDVLQLALKMAHTPEQIAAVENVLQSVQKYDAEQARMRAQNKSAPMTRIVPGKSGPTAGSAGAGETPPREIYSPEVEYTEEARQAKFEGSCLVSLVVGIDGTPSKVEVSKKIGMGMDERIVATISKWKFDPGRRYGKPVISRLNLTLNFKLFGGNTEKFFQLSEKAKAGDPAAEFELANAFFEGRDIPKDESQGTALLQRAARSGYPQAQFQMGERTYGNGNDPDTYVSAYLWYVQAQRSGFEQAGAKVTELESRMTPDQLSEARKRLENSTVTPQE